MNTLQINIENYLDYCTKQKRLDAKTIKAYQIDLLQFRNQIDVQESSKITTDILEAYIATLHQNFKPKTVKRKLASIDNTKYSIITSLWYDYYIHIHTRGIIMNNLIKENIARNYFF